MASQTAPGSQGRAISRPRLIWPIVFVFCIDLLLATLGVFAGWQLFGP